MMTPSTTSTFTPAACGTLHPNEFDLRRIARMLQKRARYRYVAVSVIPAPSGYRIASPCCSRTIDPDGGDIDIALIEFDESASIWKLYGKDHERSQWQLHLRAETLRQLVKRLNEDPARIFWQ